MTSESALLSHIARRSAGLRERYPFVLAGPGDDCAGLIGAALGRVVLATTDQLVEGRHYDPRSTPIDAVARKAVARSVSDIAAAGGAPLFALASAALRDGFSDDDTLFDAMHRWAIHFGCPLVGGDIARSPGPTVLTLAVIGAAHPGRGFIGRGGAKAGDGVYVTGRLGGSLASGRHLTFTPRLPEAAALCDALGPRLTSMMDISDGLGRDAARIAAASSVRIEIAAAAIPAHTGADWRAAAADGEDYELLFTASAAPPPAVVGTTITRVGSVVPGAGCVLRAPDGAMLDASAMGWEHAG